jgi:flagellar basal-body rod protein FlgB
MIDVLTTGGSLPVLERLLQFSGQRHRLIVDNIANLDTPGFRPADVSVRGFQEQLGAAIDRSRQGGGGPLQLQDSPEVEVQPDGLILHPQPAGENILFHDGNDRDLDRTMQDLVENFMTFRAAAELVRGYFGTINSAIAERA